MLEGYIETITGKEEFDRVQVINMIAAFATAALARLDPSIRTIIPKMVELLANPKYGALVAKHFFRALLAPSVNLCIENGDIISKLREIRLFSLAVLPIARMWQASLEDAYKRNYFIAIAAMIEHMPTTAFLVEENIDLMFIVVLEGSLCEDDRAKAVYLKILPQLNDLFPKQAEDHLETITVRMTDPFIPKCIAGNVHCRVLGLEVLTRLVKEHIGVSKKMNQNQRLAARLQLALPTALEDGSRRVRKAAEQLRLALLLVE